MQPIKLNLNEPINYKKQKIHLSGEDQYIKVFLKNANFNRDFLIEEKGKKLIKELLNESFPPPTWDLLNKKLSDHPKGNIFL
jgi:hypothetical protein